MTFHINQKAYLYADTLAIEFPEGSKGQLLSSPVAKDHDGMAIYEEKAVFQYQVTPAPEPDFRLSITYQGCEEDLCALPTTVEIGLNGNLARQEAKGETCLQGFRILGQASGYLPPKDFLRWADEAEFGKSHVSANPLLLAFQARGLWLALLLLLPLGVLLNLTPCVLPMIPINLAIIGAGKKAASKAGGFRRGLLYGLGMAVAYGALGVVTVLTGAQFGAINASPVFNFAIAVLFLLLALAMFEVFHIDFTRWRGISKVTGAASVFAMGALSAILAGACVAPVLLWALVLAADLYSKGVTSGLALPFFLGLGMALPWPLLGAGLGALPRPGAWMLRIRQAFGVLILLFAAYYAWTGYRLCGNSKLAIKDGWHTSYAEASQEASQQHKILFLEFSGIACKACRAMDHVTFRDAEVQKRMKAWAKIELCADDPARPEEKALASSLEVLGVPTFFLAVPEK